MIEQKDGTITYLWKNSTDPRPRIKMTVFRYLPELDLIVAGGMYLAELDDRTVDELVRRADARMYQDKARSKA